MFNLGFNNKYKIVHICNELGENIIGGAGTYLNEIYRYKHKDMGFVYVDFDYRESKQFIEGFGDKRDILVITPDELQLLDKIDCNIVVIHFYELYFCLREEFVNNNKIAYVIHSVPTTEPMSEVDFFGGNDDVRYKFQTICDLSDVLICVSRAEKSKLIKIFPEYENKITVVYNGITFNDYAKENINYKTKRKLFGYIGRIDSRKGILETIEAIKNLDVELLIAGMVNDDEYFRLIKGYIDGGDLWNKVKFMGWCQGKRKEEFFGKIDALIIPSMYEPFGYVALEAMNYMVPVISSNNGGLDEILCGYKYKYAPYKVGALKKCIEDFCNDPTPVINQQMEVIKRSKTNFSADKMCDRYYELWEEMINK